jgi:hypothetical protein
LQRCIRGWYDSNNIIYNNDNDNAVFRLYTFTRKIGVNDINISRYHRRKYLRMRAAAIVIQTQMRGYLGRKHYRAMRTGYMRLQALIRSRILSHKFKHLRGHIIRIQVYLIYHFGLYSKHYNYAPKYIYTND